MASATQTGPITPRGTEGVLPYRFTVRQFERMIEAGVFPDDARVELLGGVLAEQVTKYPPHDFTVGRLGGLLRAMVSPGWVVREEKSVVLGPTWRPEPDLAVAVGPDDRYRSVQPTAKDIELVIEVADSSYPTDRGVKWHGYASAKVPAYWVVDLSKRRVEVFTDPAGRGKTARYRDTKVYGDGESVPVVVGESEAGKIALKDILP